MSVFGILLLRAKSLSENLHIVVVTIEVFHHRIAQGLSALRLRLNLSGNLPL